MIRRGRMAAAVTAAVAAGSLLLASCSHVRPSLGEYAITTGHGTFSNQQVIHCTAPGGNTKLGNGTTSWYFPANVRNYRTDPKNGDRAYPSPEFTGPGPNGEQAIALYLFTYVSWEINPAICADNKVKVGGKVQQWSFASHFLNFCLKYPCAINHAQNNTENAKKLRSSDPGWLAMSDGLIPNAIDNATQNVLVHYPPNVWESSGEHFWPTIAHQIATRLSTELQALDGSSAEGQPDYFCGPGSTTKICKPFLVSFIRPMQPVDPGVIQAYNQQQQAQFQLNAANLRLEVAKKLYGPDANWQLAMSDLVTKCQNEKVPCYFDFPGQAPIHP